jgi:hypothetical protein
VCLETVLGRVAIVYEQLLATFQRPLGNQDEPRQMVRRDHLGLQVRALARVVDEASQTARFCGGVNTVIIENNNWISRAETDDY